MFLFYHLLLAHLCADLAFQTKELFYWKKKSLLASIVHSFIFIAITAFFCSSYFGSKGFIIYLLILIAARIIVDRAGLWFTKSQRFDNIFTYLVIQLTYIALLLPVIFMPSLSSTLLLEDTVISSLYNNDMMVLYLSFFIAVVYGGAFILYYLKRTFIDINIRFQFDYPGMAERLIVFSSCLIGGFWLMFIPAVIILKSLVLLVGIKGGVLRLNSPAFQFQKIRVKGNISMDLIASPLYAVLMAVILKGL